MANLVLTVIGEDRAGLVEALAEIIAEHGGNWEQSELAELAGAFAGIVLVSVPDARLEALTSSLHALDGLLRITAQTGSADADAVAEAGSTVEFTVMGNDRPGIVRDVTRILVRRGLSIDRFASRTLEAPMAGGTLFEATVSARAAASADLDAATADLEELAGEIQVDLAVG